VIDIQSPKLRPPRTALSKKLHSLPSSIRRIRGWLVLAFSAGGDGGTKSGWGRMANVKSIGWAIYAAGFVIWLFGYVSTGHAAVFDWDVVTPWWISSFVPNPEAELGLALMFVSMIPIYWRAKRG